MTGGMAQVECDIAQRQVSLDEVIAGRGTEGRAKDRPIHRLIGSRHLHLRE